MQVYFQYKNILIHRYNVGLSHTKWFGKHLYLYFLQDGHFSSKSHRQTLYDKLHTHRYWEGTACRGYTRHGVGQVYTHVKNDLQVRTEKHEKQIKTKKKKFHELLKLFFFFKSRKIDTQTHRKCFKKIFQTYPVKILSDPVHVMRSLYVSILL